MRDLNFSVKEQLLTKEGDFSNLVSGSIGYLRCKFDLSSDWSGKRLIAVFTYKDVESAVGVSSDGTCMVPNDIVSHKYFKLQIVGVSQGSLVKTNKVLVEMEV